MIRTVLHKKAKFLNNYVFMMISFNLISNFLLKFENAVENGEGNVLNNFKIKMSVGQY